MDSFTTPPDIVLAALIGIAFGYFFTPLIWHILSCLWCGGDPIKQARKAALHSAKANPHSEAKPD